MRPCRWALPCRRLKFEFDRLNESDDPSFSTMSSIQGLAVYLSILKIQGLGMRASSVAVANGFGINRSTGTYTESTNLHV